MKATELIHQLNLLIAEAGGDPEVLVNDNGSFVIGYRADVGYVQIDEVDAEEEEDDDFEEEPFTFEQRFDNLD